jgi:hypothetical protein
LLVQNQFFQRLQILTKSFQNDISFAISDGNNAGFLEAVLHKFSQTRFDETYDDGTEPSLKARLIGLLATCTNMESRFKMTSELPISGGKYRLDIYLKSLNNQELSKVFEVKSIPIHWLEPGHFGRKGLNDIQSKEYVSKKIKECKTEELLQLPLNQKMAAKWGTNYATVGDYIQNGRNQIRKYMQRINNNDTNECKDHCVGYLVWAVGMMSIRVEYFE